MDPLTIARATIELSGADGRATLPYLLHQSVADLFGDTDARGYLYRVMRSERHRHVVLVLSAAPPLPLERLASWPHRRTVALEQKPFAPCLRAGQRLDYELRLNAAQVVHDGTHRRRVDVWEAVWGRDPETELTPHEVYGAYLQRKLRGAAELLEARVVERGEVRARRPAGGEPVQFVAVNLTGCLRIESPEALLATMAAGVGRSKAFGCGLLCLSQPGTILPRRHAAEAGPRP